MIIKYSKGEIDSVVTPNEENAQELDNTLKEAYEKKQEMEKTASNEDGKTPFWIKK